MCDAGLLLVNVNNSQRTTFDNAKTHDNMAGWASVSNGRKTLLHFDRCLRMVVRVCADDCCRMSIRITAARKPNQRTVKVINKNTAKIYGRRRREWAPREEEEEEEEAKNVYNQQQQVAFLNRFFRRCFRLPYTCLLLAVVISASFLRPRIHHTRYVCRCAVLAPSA